MRGSMRIAIFGVFAALSGVTAWYRMLTGFSDWDDEGFFLLSVKQFLDGHKLYDQVWTIYGPFYYACEALLYRITGLTPSHDAVRLFSVISWILAPLICAWIVWRVTRLWALSAATHLATSANLWFFTNEPGHPQEVCLVLLLLLAAGRVEDRRPRVIACAAAVLAAAMALTKVNAGVFAAAVAGLILLLRTRRSPLVRALIIGLALAIAALPTVLMGSLFSEGWVRYWWLTATPAIGCCLAVVLRTPAEGDGDLRTCGLAAVSAIACALLIITPFLFSGTTLRAMLWLTVGRVTGFGQLFFAPVGFDALSLISAGGSLLVLALYLSRCRVSRVIPALKLLAGAGIFTTVLLYHPSYAIKYAWPWAWLTAVSGSGTLSLRRGGLCLLAGVQVLYAFPVAGSQAAFAAILLIVTAAVCLGDILPCTRATAIAAGLLVLGGHIYYLIAARTDYRSLVSLDLPGAHRVHVDADTRNAYHWVADRIHQNCSGFLTMPGLDSFYFWTGQPSPTLVALDDWVGFLNDAEQQRMVDDFARVARPCVVYNPALVDFWIRRGTLPRRPMVRWIEDHFSKKDAFDDWQLLLPKRP